MSIKKKTLLSLALCLTAFALFGIEALADTIKLRDGTVLKGKVVSYNQRRFTIVIRIGSTNSQHDIPVDEIESIEFDSTETGGASITGRSTIPPPTVNPETGISAGGASTAAVDSTIRDPAPTSTAPSAANKTDELATIAEKTVSVAAAADWTSSEIRVQKGQHIVISAIGDVDLGDGKRTGPEGLDLQDKDKLMQGKKTGALIAVIGDDNNDFEFIGTSSEFIAKHNGILFLSINEGNLRDNNGAFVARVRVLSNR